jgi:hypothetical protein
METPPPSMKVGDLVVCNCIAETWYKGVPGMLVGFSPCTKDPMVLYFNGEVMRLAKSGLEAVN